MFVNRIREQVKAVKKRDEEHEATMLKTRHLNTRLELMQNFFEQSARKDHSKTLSSPEKSDCSLATRLVMQDNMIQKKISSGDCEASFLYKNKRRHVSSNDVCLHNIMTKSDLKQETRRHSSPEVLYRR